MAELPDPIAEGDLESNPFAQVLAHVAVRQITGSIVLWPAPGEDPRGQDRIRVEEGIITAGRLVDRPPVLDRGLVPFFGRTAGPYAVYETIDLVGDNGLSQRVDPLALLATASRSIARDDAIDRLLEQLGPRQLRLRGGADFKRFGLLSKEERFIDVLRGGPGTPAELVRACELGEQLGKRLVYMLLLTKNLEPYDAAARTSLVGPRPATAPSEVRLSQLPLPPEGPPSGASPSPKSSGTFRPIQTQRLKEAPPLPPDPPAGLAPEQLAFWKEVIERSRAIDTQNYFDMIGVARDAGPDAVMKEYFALAKRWHPDRVTGLLAPLKPYVERVFGYLTAAQDTLVDEKKRGAYLRQVQDGGGTPEADRKVGAIITAAMEHQKAEVLIRRRDFEGARGILEAAIDLNPEEADAHASLAWVLFNLPSEKPSMMLEAADRALKIAPNHDRAHYARAMVLRRQGDEARAMEAFRAAATANPKNIDAVREVRLADMRAGHAADHSSSSPRAGAKPAPEGNFFSKLFQSPKKK